MGLLSRAQSGDPQAFAQLTDGYRQELRVHCYRMLGSTQDAEDALQETFVQALRHSDGVQPETFRGWLFTIAHQQAMLLKRKEKRLPAQVDDLVLLGLAARPVEDLTSRADDARRVRELVDLLPAPQRAVIAARIFEGKTFREVATSLGCPLNTALARMHTGLKKLRQMWEAGYA